MKYQLEEKAGALKNIKDTAETPALPICDQILKWNTASAGSGLLNKFYGLVNSAGTRGNCRHDQCYKYRELLCP